MTLGRTLRFVTAVLAIFVGHEQNLVWLGCPYWLISRDKGARDKDSSTHRLHERAIFEERWDVLNGRSDDYINPSRESPAT